MATGPPDPRPTVRRAVISHITIAFTYDDLVVLEVIIEAADTYSNRYGGRAITGVSNQQLEDLRRWVGNSQRWFFKDED